MQHQRRLGGGKGDRRRGGHVRRSKRMDIAPVSFQTRWDIYGNDGSWLLPEERDGFCIKLAQRRPKSGAEQRIHEHVGGINRFSNFLQVCAAANFQWLDGKSFQ